MIKQCKHCNSDFNARIQKRQYCSVLCAMKDVRGVKVVPTFVCAHCNKLTERKKNKHTKGYVYSTKFCSHSCASKANKKPSVLKECPQCNGNFELKVGYNKQKFCSKTCAYKSYEKGGFVHRGYRVVSKKFEHRVVMENKIGRKLLASETVHHINGDKLDNRPENLELWSSRHCKGQRVIDQVQWALELLTRYPEVVAQSGYFLINRDSENKVLTISQAMNGLMGFAA